MLAACGGSGSSENNANATQKTAATVTGVVSFPVLSALVAKQVAAAATVIPPVLTITDLSGAVIATPTLTVDPSDSKKFTYTVSLDASKNYVFKASWGGQLLRGLADQSTLSTLTTIINVTPVSTAAVLVAEQRLNLGAGQLGTTAAGAVTTAQLGAVNPAALLSAIENGRTTTYAPLIGAVTDAVTRLNDPARDTAVTAAVNTAPAYTAPLNFTSAMISGKLFKNVEGDILSFKADGTLTVFKPDGVTVSKIYTWVLNPDGTILLSNPLGWARFTLTANNSPISLTVSDIDNSGATETNKVWTYYTPATTPTTGSVAGTYVITVNGSGNPVTVTLAITASGTITGTDSQGAPVTGTVNTQTGAFTTTAAATATNGNAPVSSTGTINLSTGAMSGSFTVTHTDGTTETGTFSGTRTSTGTTTPAFSSAMVSGKTFSDGTGGTVTFNTDGSFLEKETAIISNTGTWVINSSGKLVLTFTSHTATLTLVSATTSTLNVTITSAYSNGSTSSGAMTLTESTGGSATPPQSVAGTYSITAAGMTSATLTIDATGKITGTDWMGSAVTGTANLQTGTFTTSVAIPDKPGYFVISNGSLNLVTGAMTGTYNSTYPGSTNSGTFTGIRTNTSSSTGSVTAYW